MNTKVIELLNDSLTKIELTITENNNEFSFWSDSDLLFAEVSSPEEGEMIPLTARTIYFFSKPKTFFVKGSAGNRIFLSTFTK